MYLEKFVTDPRHVEIQVMADKTRQGRALRRARVLGAAPAPEAPRGDALRGDDALELREEMGAAACRLAKRKWDTSARARSSSSTRGGEFYFLEMNTRLQVEHPITELCYRVDLVEEQLRVATGQPLRDVLEPQGHAIEVRVNAEDPETFFPSLGTIQRFNSAGGPGVRLDAVIYRGLEVTGFYDSMLGKLIVHADDRPRAIARMRRALSDFRVIGVTTSIPACLRVLEDPRFVSGEYDTGILSIMPRGVADEVLDVAALAAALAKYRGTARPDRTAGAGSGDPSNQPSPWVLADRVARLGRRS